MDNESYVVHYKPSKSRFYILFTFAFYSFVYSFIWNSWQPIMIPFQHIYNWSLTEINLLININTIVFCVFIAPFVMFWNKFGMKVSFVISTMCVLVGAFMRVYPGSIQVQSIMILAGNSVSSFGNMITAVGCTGISALWFPSEERARSTTASLSFGYLGSAIAPLVDSVLALLALIFVVVYFPSRPAIMPCKSSERSLRIDLIPGCKTLMKNGQFWLVFAMNFIGAGINSGVTSVLPSIIISLGVSQDNTAILVCVCTLCTFCGTLLAGWLCDRFGYKVTITCTVLPTIVLSTIFGLQIINIIPHNLVSIYVVTTLFSFVSPIIGPVSYEMGCEAAFPVSEEVASAMIGMASNIGTMLFLFITMIPNIGTNWVPLSYAVCSVFLLPLMYVYNGVRLRLDCDHNEGIQNIIDPDQETSSLLI